MIFSPFVRVISILEFVKLTSSWYSEDLELTFAIEGKKKIEAAGKEMLAFWSRLCYNEQVKFDAGIVHR